MEVDSKKIFYDIFDVENLHKHYEEKIKIKPTVGIDNVNLRVFDKDKDSVIERISYRVFTETYKFSSYKEKLISKGKNKFPRIISIPTLRDKLTLSLIKDYLLALFPEANMPVSHSMINEISIISKTSNYDYILKYDIKTFFDSINHHKLISILELNIHKSVLNLIIKAIRNDTKNSNDILYKKITNTKGVPQGLPISNILASIYLLEFDKIYKTNTCISYFRYVDDILIFTSNKNKKKIKESIEDNIENKFLLELNPEKHLENTINEGFSFLGYSFNDKLISVRKNSVLKLERSLEKIFLDYIHTNPKKIKSYEIFLYLLNLRISGCIKNNKKYGWLFYFSQINDISLLFRLDNLINTFAKRFNISLQENDCKIKKFVRAYNEITKNLHNSRYIINFDNFLIEEKKIFLTDIIGMKNVENKLEKDINYLFDKYVFIKIKELEKDIQSFS
ncbi:MAG: hypothetical protein A2015_13060 [Spirochaetes bacterium GWF1_31_7]|nr:MAG: hypothetical protein A2Y30_00465 [Spirochaetes bacterium GWE1_32_154]OHD51315.1 MAG: hypothetical protein A2Y29_00910 [Spirochaetes bacterium GWE2_31_10]OHD51512.1 MAG: hypothetical protein A2015_13060 [Spirochaetes bacterium GWF1_31_7]HBD95860.1 hypothetical protein [Spirochaetia bacterium]HBI38136.1 hypothetical protein [Spirochaetia bacterium]